MEDTKALLSITVEVSCTCVRRQANGIAHRLARYGSSVELPCAWLDSPPNFILDLLFKDCNLT